MRKLLTIGELAHALSINASTIRYYEKEGLIKPSRVDSNDYRLYDFDKMDRLENLLMLKKLGIPLKELKDLVDNYSLEKYNGMLEVSLSKIDVKLESLLVMKKMVEKKLSYTKSIYDLESPFELIEYPERKLVLLHKGELLKISIKELYDYMKQFSWFEYSKIDCSYVQPYGKDCYGFYVDSQLFEESEKVCDVLYLPKGNYLSYGFFIEIDQGLTDPHEIIAEEDKLIDAAVERFSKYLKKNKLILCGEYLYKQQTRTSKVGLYSAYMTIEGLVNHKEH